MRTLRLTVGLVAAALCAGAAACDGGGGAKAPGPARAANRPADPALAEAQDWLAAEVAAQPGQLAAEFVAAPMDLAPRAVIDVATASAAAGTLEFTRLTLGDAQVECERVSYDSAAQSGRLERAVAPSAAFTQFVNALRVLPGLAVKPREGLADGAPGSEFFVLVRIRGATQGADVVREFAGRLGEKDAVRFAGPRAICARATGILRTLRFTRVADTEVRTSHDSDAFARGRTALTGHGRAWLAERCAEALCVFGRADAAESARFVRDNVDRAEPRIVARLAALCDEPDLYLDGPPRPLPGR